jgi:hypothetical protein
MFSFFLLRKYQKSFYQVSHDIIIHHKIKKCEIKNIKGYGQTNNSYLYSKAAKSYFDEPREKLSSRPLCGRDKTISRSSKDFVAKVYTTFCVEPENL